MTRTRWIWLVLAVLDAAFFSGYTSIGGPLSDEEIDGYMGMATGNAESPPPEKLAILRRYAQSGRAIGFVLTQESCRETRAQPSSQEASRLRSALDQEVGPAKATCGRCIEHVAEVEHS